MPLVRISLAKGKTPEVRLAALGMRREDVWVNLVEVAKENWSFGNGVASYAPQEQLQLQ